jgi:hypothetical protein
VARHLDFVLLALALPLFLVASLPILGWVVGAGCYLVQRALAAYLEARARAADNPRAFVGLTAGSMVGRGYLVALTILAVGLLVDDEVGLSAAVLFLAAFTVYFTVSMILRPFQNS